ncbi:MAG: DNA cytosine methyltransferase [Bryobacteraceae bacterium]|nr:DNA cytosine methyltransferase [Bryobacteraceae bacterium]
MQRTGVARMWTFYEFFAGGGMARAGLGEDWQCLFANDIDARKGASYAANWGGEQLTIEDVGKLRSTDVPGRADMAWASFPCQDLSLAGDYAGLQGERSGTFWPFWRLMEALAEEGRPPAVVVLENVCGALTSHGGKDFAAIGDALASGGYRFGALVIDAIRFLPQSRPRLIVAAVCQGRAIPEDLMTERPSSLWHPANLVGAYEKLSRQSKDGWLWWNLPAPPARQSTFGDVIEHEPQGVAWHTAAETRRLLDLMSPINREKVEQAKRAGKRMVGGIYKRTRRDEYGQRAQRAEVRFDDIAGCLRTPAGGSSRQTIVIVEGNGIRSRLLTPREAARLMGLPESYDLPTNYNEAYHLAGDGVAVPVVRFLAVHLLEPLLAGAGRRSASEAA